MKTLLFLGIIIFYTINYLNVLMKNFQMNTSYLFWNICSRLFNIILFYDISKTICLYSFKNMKEADEKPLYDFNSITYKENQMNGMKYNLNETRVEMFTLSKPYIAKRCP